VRSCVYVITVMWEGGGSTESCQRSCNCDTWCQVCVWEYTVCLGVGSSSAILLQRRHQCLARTSQQWFAFHKVELLPCTRGARWAGTQRGGGGGLVARISTLCPATLATHVFC
jgi:hypothetical protein